MAKIIDLDAFAPDDIEVILNGKTWLIPGDLDVNMLIRMMKYAQSDDPKEQIKVMDAVINLFRQRQSAEEVENLSLGIKQVHQLFNGLVSQVQEDSEKNGSSQA